MPGSDIRAEPAFLLGLVRNINMLDLRLFGIVIGKSF